MAMMREQDFNRTALTVQRSQAWYTGQRAERIPHGLIGLVGADCSSLDLSYNNLVSLTALKEFANLEELVLDNNCLCDLNTLPRMPKLTTLSVNNNKVTDIERALDRIKECCPCLKYASLLGNPGCPDQLTNPTTTDEEDYERYRRYAVHVLPATLRFLDSRPISSRERQEARERGSLMRMVRVNLPNLSSLTAEEFARALDHKRHNSISVEEPDYTPLPDSMRGPLDVRSAYGKSRYRYSGKNSEGNRFISNSDL
ncbi:leucine-rich melanocyte differentiation-associated protein-like isoform X1 [Neodiprion virginianus]|uniref:Leucine-rich melanocyte differentiation-associated protein isoform X1 n=1 Tax=Neodiprion lecontei TaxID=441921 RepID=A0A6J0BPA9_NEOLC|nr:leucine-rich melanocyte differentiation-associated protein isoform X1 [Neodiprion lecontei]XP_046423511.1 leucine-rich melanocyte differentiation-associated protein-like isoform X1 [Neodiprion fabricii]XP_046617180.1 leucine-rich melanocyte differentiation-associated protein-like isoform X1 [Neodiprion virginianus]